MTREGKQGSKFSWTQASAPLYRSSFYSSFPTGENTWAFWGGYPSMYNYRKMPGMSTVMKLFVYVNVLCMCGWVGLCVWEREDSYVFILWLIIIWPKFKSWVYLLHVFISLTKSNSEKIYWDWSKLILTIVTPVLFSEKSVISMPDWIHGANEQCDEIPPAWPDTEPRCTETLVRSVYPHLLFHCGRQPTHHCDSHH